MESDPKELPVIPPIKCADDIAPHQEAVLIRALGWERFNKLQELLDERQNND